MKTVVIGDIHGRSTWKLIVNIEKPDRVIFIGDYFDSYDLLAVEQMYNFNEIIEYKEKSISREGTLQEHKTEVIMLIGNHDYHYYPEIGNTGTSGYQYGAAAAISKLIDDNRNHLRMAYQMDEFLFTHAGVSSVFMDQVFGKGGWKVENLAIDVHELFKYKPKTFEFGTMLGYNTYRDPTGDNEGQSPIWIRPKSLMRANKDTLRKEIIQVVGHTQQIQIDVKGMATGGRYYFIDTLGTSGEYLIIEDEHITTGQI